MKRKTRAHFTRQDNSLVPMRWILVADRGSAKIFQSKGKNHLAIVEKFENPEGKKRSAKLGTDRPGRSFASVGSSRSALSQRVEPAEHQADLFAKQLAKRLNEGRTHQDFEQLILVASAKFLGRVRSFLNKPTSGKVLATYEKDYAKLSASEIKERLSDLIE